MKVFGVVLISLALAFAGGIADAKGKSGGGSRPHYGGGKHTSSHDGSYKGGSGSSHRGGTYKNDKTGDRYGQHK